MGNDKRLVKRNDQGEVRYATPCKGNSVQELYEEGREKDKAIMDKLCELEEKIENGTLIELPCKVGDTMYYLVEYNIDNAPHIKKVKVERFDFSDYYKTGNSKLGVYTDLGVITYNDNLFLTKAEAEAKLKELQR